MTVSFACDSRTNVRIRVYVNVDVVIRVGYRLSIQIDYLAMLLRHISDKDEACMQLLGYLIRCGTYCAMQYWTGFYEIHSSKHDSSSSIGVDGISLLVKASQDKINNLNCSVACVFRCVNVELI